MLYCVIFVDLKAPHVTDFVRSWSWYFDGISHFWGGSSFPFSKTLEASTTKEGVRWLFLSFLAFDSVGHFGRFGLFSFSTTERPTPPLGRTPSGRVERKRLNHSTQEVLQKSRKRKKKEETRGNRTDVSFGLFQKMRNKGITIKKSRKERQRKMRFAWLAFDVRPEKYRLDPLS